MARNAAEIARQGMESGLNTVRDGLGQTVNSGRFLTALWRQFFPYRLEEGKNIRASGHR
jgi:hypothetical protein